jgi:hypothetical protein
MKELKHPYTKYKKTEIWELINTALDAFTKNQVLKDIQLLKDGMVDKVEWNFFTSAQTGKGGANDNLKNFIDKSLQEAGIDASKFELKPVRTETF